MTRSTQPASPTTEAKGGHTQVPLFSCSDENCRVECSYPADMLAMLEGQPICEGCYEDNPPFDPVDWSALPRFVPADKQLIAELLEALEGLERYLRDTPHHNAVQAAHARKIIAKAVQS